MSLVFMDKRFVEAVNTIFTETPKGDTRLRKLVAACLVERKAHHGMYEELVRALTSNCELAFYMLCHEWKIDIPEPVNDREAATETNEMTI
jgi:hypothetical protein